MSHAHIRRLATALAAIAAITIPLTGCGDTSADPASSDAFATAAGVSPDQAAADAAATPVRVDVPTEQPSRGAGRVSTDTIALPVGAPADAAIYDVLDTNALVVDTPTPHGAYGAFPATHTYVSRVIGFTLTAPASAPATVTGLTIAIDGQRPTPTGTVLYADAPEQMPDSDISFSVASDASDKAWRTHYEPLDGRVAVPAGPEMPVIAAGQSYRYQARVTAPPNTDTFFHIVVTFADGTQAIVRDGTRNFRITAYPDTTDNAYVPTTTDYQTITIQHCRWANGCVASYIRPHQ